MTADDRDLEVETLLRGFASRLEPTGETWPAVRRRARRRKQAKALLSATAVAVVTAGAIPAVIAVRATSDNRPLPAAGQHTPPIDQPPSPVTVPTAMSRLVPESVSFVSPTQGWVSGDVRVAGGTVTGGLGRTIDGGRRWLTEPASPRPAGQVRFANARTGFSFGPAYEMTNDGGLTWHELPTPGYLITLATMRGRVWTLARSCRTCQRPRLFGATLAAPHLRRVSQVPPIGRADSALTLHDDSVFVTGGAVLWRSLDGTTWRKGRNPCGGGDQAFSAWGPTGLAAECTPEHGPGSLFESDDGGLHWTNIANVPPVRAGVGTLSAGTPDDLVITTGRGAPYVSHDAGGHWTRAHTGPGPVTFASYISDRRIVGIRSGARPAFVSSNNAGRTWSVTPFAG